jgi:dethiobiotin synthetase
MTVRVLFVAGAHTEIGKTHVACALLRAAQDAGWTTDALKPVVSGFDEAAWDDSDPGRLLAALGRAATEQELDRLSPFRFLAPLAPPMAAALEGRSLSLADTLGFCRQRIAASCADLMVVEGVGGLMSPIADGATSLDLLQALAPQSVLVGGGYLGAISHTLTALEVMRARGVAPAAVVLSETADPQAPDFRDTVRMLSGHAGETPVLTAPRDEGQGWARPVLRRLLA